MVELLLMKCVTWIAFSSCSSDRMTNARANRADPIRSPEAVRNGMVELSGLMPLGRRAGSECVREKDQQVKSAGEPSKYLFSTRNE